jgi:O-antigen ligase
VSDTAWPPAGQRPAVGCRDAGRTSTIARHAGGWRPAAALRAPGGELRAAVLIPVVVLAVAVPLRTGGEGAGLAHVTPADAVSALLVLLALAPLATAGGYRWLAGDGRLQSPMLLPVATTLFAATVATLLADDLIVGISGYVRVVQLALCVPLAVYVALRSQRDLWLLLGAFVVLGAGESALGIVQFLTGSGAGYGPEAIRGVGTFGAYEILAMGSVATTGLVMAFAVALCARGRTRRVALLAVALCAGGVVVSLSRGFWMATIVGGFAALLAAGRRRLAAGLVIAVGLALTVVSTGIVTPSGTLGDRLDSATEAFTRPDQSLLDRYALWDAATAMWSDVPVWGVGLKHFERYRDQYTGLGFSGLSDIADSDGFRRVELLTPHNRYLLTLAEQGVLGLSAMVLLYGGALVGATRRLARHADTPPVRAFGVAMVAATAVDLFSWLSDDAAGSLAVLSAVVLGGLLWFAAGLAPGSIVEEHP